MELNINYRLSLPIPELILHGSRGVATEARNSGSSGSKRIALLKLCKGVLYRPWKNKLLKWKLVNVDVKEQWIVLLRLLNGNKEPSQLGKKFDSKFLLSIFASLKAF